jgi:class 3 adenylate cyclase/Cdc6-like AAA superfamily ATPase
MPSERVQRQIDRLLDQAEAAATAEDWARAADCARKVLAVDADNADAAAFLSMAEGQESVPPANRSQPAAAPEAPSAPPLPSSFAGGRYAVRRFLGEGGRKRVYLAHDEKLKRDVAVAVIKTDGLDAQGLSRVNREAQAMAQLGDQPNIVTIFDVGDDNGQPYIVSQYMSGGAVDTLEMPLPIERTLEIAKGVCRGLAHAHKHGVVHRDLKPGNVWLAADGTAEIGDFGLAVAFEQSRLTMHGMLVGTVAYMPPEQALGSEVTPRADLYSLGCMLYELITGKPPFTSDNPTAVISQHINTPPVAPSWLADACPQELEEIVLRLLAKEPGERPASADEVLAMLERVDPAQKSASHSDSNVLDRLALGVFVGRESELERLRKAFDNAVSGRGGLVMLVGEPGIGKTRTTQELETYAKMRGATVLWGRTHESAGAPPYWPWIQAGNQYAAAHQDDLPTVIGPQMTPEAINELTRIFPWLLTGVSVTAPPEISDPEVAQFRLFDAYAQYLRAIAAQGPLVVALDDLHWADKPTLQLLQHISRELSRMRVLIVGNYRDTDITRQSALSETLASLNRESGFDRIVLRGLSRDEVAAYIKARANVEPRKDVLDRIFEETEGNAFFLSEVVNLMAQEGTLTKTSISDIAIPDGVREALGRRLNRLSEETNELLQVAAIIGRDFTYDTLTLLGPPERISDDRDDEALLKMIEEALEARVIEETEQAGRYRFTHAQMQETLLAELSTTRRVRLHGQVGEALEKRYGRHAEERAGRLAMHFSEAATLSPRFSEKAMHYAMIAGRQALGQSAYAEAARHFRAALSAREGQEVDEEMAGLLTDLGKAALATAQVTEAWRSFRQAFEFYAKTNDPHRAAEVSYLAGTHPLLLRRSQTQLIQRALEIVEDGSADCGRLNAALGQSAAMLGDEAVGREAFARASEVARSLGLRGLELDVLYGSQVVAMFHLRLDESIAFGTRTIALARELERPDIEAPACFFAGAASFFSGRLDEAALFAEATRDVTRRTRNPYGLASAGNALAVTAGGRGDWATARKGVELGLETIADFRALSAGAYIAYQVGETETAKGFNKRLLEAVALVPPGPSLEYSQAASLSARAAQISGAKPDADLIRRCARAVLEHDVVATPLLGSYAHIALATLACLTNDKTAAEELLPQIEVLGPIIVDYGDNRDHIRGLLLETLDRIGEAVEAMEAALGQVPIAYKPTRAETAYDCARIRLQRDALGDRGRARTLIDEALSTAQDLKMKPLVEKILAIKLKDQGITTETDLYTSIVAVSDSVQRERPDIAAHAAPDGTVTIMFSDIEDSTVLTERLGDQAWQQLLNKHNALIREQLKAYGGYEVKTMGDGFMVAFQSAKKGLDCAIAIQESFDGHNATNGEHVKVRIGLHAGETIKDGDDFYGKNVILASRVAGKAVGGEILVSSLLRALVESTVGAAMFGEPREVELKGLSGTHTVFAVVAR